LPGVGLEGQEKIKSSRVLIVGTGGLGSPIALYLAAAGIGTLGLVDFDTVDASNLQRQIIHSTSDIHKPKTVSAKDKITALNPNTNVVIHNVKLTSQNALKIMENYDIIADGTDNFQTRYLINDACVLLGKPNVYGSIFQFEGQVSTFCTKEGPCYRCFHHMPPSPGLIPSCGEGGVIGVIPGIIGTIQACEILKLILGIGDNLIERFLFFDALKMKFREFKLEKDESCPICGKNPTIRNLIDYELFCGLKKVKGEMLIESISSANLKEKINKGEKLQIIDIREPNEQVVYKFPLAKAIPFNQLVRKMNELDSSIDCIFICKIGQRSVYAIQVLRDAGYKGKMFNLQGGVNAWEVDINKNVPRY
jgi:adenylyltransferase/sulfurtransferase